MINAPTQDHLFHWNMYKNSIKHAVDVFYNSWFQGVLGTIIFEGKTIQFNSSVEMKTVYCQH
jgi:hypothetical protein